MSTSQQEALDFLESLKIENDKPKTSSQPVSLPTQFKPMPRPTHSIHSNPATTPTTSLTTPTTTPTPVGMPFKPMQRPPTTSLGTFRPVGPPPVVNSSQTKTKQKRVFQEFNPGNVPNATTTIQSAGQQNTIKPSGNVFDNPADQGLDTYQPVQYENVSLQQPSLNSQYQQPNQQKHQHHQDQKVGTFQGNGNEWWGSLFTTAQKGLQTARETAKGLAEEGARVVKESNVVKDFGGKI